MLGLMLGLMLAPAAALAQGFAGLGSDAAGFRLPDPGTVLEFPRDHGPHPGFRIEWWYMTANLVGEDGRDYGLQWTLFRSALAPDDNPPPIWMGHAAVTTPDAHHAAERLARGGIGQAGVMAGDMAEPFRAWIDDWQMTGIETGRLTARAADFAYDIAFEAHGPFVPQGENGYSVKAPTGQASHYYSQPFYKIRGTLSLPGGDVAVSGLGWLDREWSSQPLAPDQTGWDWFSLHLDSGEKLMGFRLRARSGPPYTVATWIAADGTPAPLPPGSLLAEPLDHARVAGRRIPVRWRLRLPARGLDITVQALNPKAWNGLTVSYWEGPVRATGSHPGVGYLEMTGYDD